MIRYVIWDAGGTLFNTYPAKTLAFQRALADMNAMADASYILSLTRQSTAHAIHALAKEFDLDLPVFEARYRQHYRAIPASEQPPFPGVKEICAYICSVGENFIVTHRGAESLHQLLRAHDMGYYFVDSLTKESPFPRKPAPGALEAVVKAHGLDPRITLAVGDRPIDIFAARAAGLRTCLYGDADVPAEIKIKDYADLLRILRAENEAKA
ncbi:MAG: HAD hydrolase-like protein [Anaerolineae bacterium]